MGNRIYDKSTWELLEDFTDKIDKKIFTKEDIVDWFSKNYPDIDEKTVKCHIVSCSANDPQRRNYSTKKQILFKLSDGKYKRYDINIDGSWSDAGIQISTIKEETNDGVEELFCQGRVLEKHIEEFVKDNLKILELELYYDEENNRSGQQFDTFCIGRMDLLCLDEKKNFVVIELKKGRESDKVVGQILRYYQWVKENLCKSDQSVHGLIITEEKDEKLDYSLKPVSDLIKLKLIKIDIKFVDK